MIGCQHVPREKFCVFSQVKNATAPLEGGGISQCVFFSVRRSSYIHTLTISLCLSLSLSLSLRVHVQIVPVEGTNTFFVVVDNERSSDPDCKPVSCPCDPVSQLLNLLILPRLSSSPYSCTSLSPCLFSVCVCALMYRSNRAAVCQVSACVPAWRRYRLKTTILASRVLPDSGLFVRERDREDRGGEEEEEDENN